MDYEYEYAGFRYIIIEVEPGEWRAVPEAGQHPVANKEKHRSAALGEWRREKGESK